MCWSGSISQGTRMGLTMNDELITAVAKAMFADIHGYHVDLRWENAYQAHRDLFLKYARSAYPVFEQWYGSVNFLDPEGKF
jgi:hypothetical protein